MSRASEEFREQLRKDVDYTDMRILSPASLARMVDAEAVNKLRASIFKQQSQGIRRMTESSGTADEMEKYRATKGDYSACAREFALQDNIAWMYFNFYGENFEGGEIMDNPDEPWECPWCHLKYKMSLKLLPDNCQRCGHLTPLGRMKKDDVFRR